MPLNVYTINGKEYRIKIDGKYWTIDYGYDVITYDLSDPSEYNSIKHIYDYIVGIGYQTSNIDWNKDIILPTHNNIRNNNIEEKGRGRKRNQNQLYSNVIISLMIGFVNNLEGDEMFKYIYDNQIEEKLEELKKEGIKVPSKNRLVKDLKLINEQLGINYVDIINSSENGLCYLIKQSIDNKYFTVVPLYKLRELTKCTNKEMLRLFVCISMHKDISTENSVIMKRSYLCKCMDLEPNEANKRHISEMTTALFKLGLIDIEVEYRTEIQDGDFYGVQYNWFRLTTYDEWKEKGKRKKKRRKR